MSPSNKGDNHCGSARHERGHKRTGKHTPACPSPRVRILVNRVVILSVPSSSRSYVVPAKRCIRYLGLGMAQGRSQAPRHVWPAPPCNMERSVKCATTGSRKIRETHAMDPLWRDRCRRETRSTVNGDLVMQSMDWNEDHDTHPRQRPAT